MPNTPVMMKTANMRSISVGWDNYQMLQHAKHETSTYGNKFLKFGTCFGVEHRTASLHLDDNVVKQARAIKRSSFLPNLAEMAAIKDRCCILVERYLVDNMPALEHLASQVNRHIEHIYSTEMAERSEVMNLGVVDADFSSNAGVNQIMLHLQSMCPMHDGQLMRIPCNGDQNSIERMCNLKRAKVREGTSPNQLAGLVENPQEFHKEGILLKVIIKLMMTVMLAGNIL
jgi:hypothetical protein